MKNFLDYICYLNVYCCVWYETYKFMHRSQIVFVLFLYFLLHQHHCTNFSSFAAFYPSLSKSLYLYTYFCNSIHVFENLNMRLRFLFCYVYYNFSFHIFFSLTLPLSSKKKKHLHIQQELQPYTLYRKWGCFQEATKLMHEFYADIFKCFKK